MKLYQDFIIIKYVHPCGLRLLEAFKACICCNIHGKFSHYQQFDINVLID